MTGASNVHMHTLYMYLFTYDMHMSIFCDSLYTYLHCIQGLVGSTGPRGPPGSPGEPVSSTYCSFHLSTFYVYLC